MKIILVRPMFSGNVGSVCRLASNFACSQIRLVKPSPLDWQIINRMAVKSMDLAGAITIHDSLAEALADTTYSIGTSARTWGDRDRTIDLPSFRLPLDPPPLFKDTALVFGSEENGLTNDELTLCHSLVTVPTSPVQPSMNLSHAVAVVTAHVSALFTAMQDNGSIRPAADFAEQGSDPGEQGDDFHFKKSRNRARAKSNEIEGLISHLHAWLDHIKYLNPQNPEHIMKDLREVVYRAGLTSREVRMARGIISKSGHLCGFSNKNKK